LTLFEIKTTFKKSMKYQSGNHMLYMEEGETMQWPKEKGLENDLKNTSL